jgi:hypothetical protein
MTEDGRTIGTVALCGLSPFLSLVWDHKDAQSDAAASSLCLGFVVSHPLRDETAPRMGCPLLMRTAAGEFVLPSTLIRLQSLKIALFKIALFKENPYENLSGK